jgi:outer membrane protein assembly factor BamB
VVSFNGAFAAVDFNGAIVWTNLATAFYVKHGLAGSLALHDGLILLNCDATSTGPDRYLGWHKAWDGSYVLAVDKRTGQVKWKSSRGMSRVAFTTPIVVKVGSREQVISSAGDIVEGFDFETGERVWTAINRGEGLVPSPVVGDGLVFSPSAFNTGTPDIPTAIRAFRLGGQGEVTQSHFVWQHTQSVSKVPSFVYSRPWLFTVDETGMVQCLKGDTGEVVWKNRVAPGPVGASLVLAEGHIYLLNEKGETTILKAGPEFEVLAKNPLAERCKASMAVSGGRLYIRGQANLYCLGNRAD